MEEKEPSSARRNFLAPRAYHERGRTSAGWSRGMPAAYRSRARVAGKGGDVLKLTKTENSETMQALQRALETVSGVRSQIKALSKKLHSSDELTEDLVQARKHLKRSRRRLEHCVARFGEAEKLTDDEG